MGVMFLGSQLVLGDAACMHMTMSAYTWALSCWLLLASMVEGVSCVHHLRSLLEHLQMHEVMHLCALDHAFASLRTGNMYADT